MRIKILLLFLVLFSSLQASAYIDPGTGSLLIQMMVAGILGALATIKIYWSRIKALFKSRQPQAEKNSGNLGRSSEVGVTADSENTEELHKKSS